MDLRYRRGYYLHLPRLTRHMIEHMVERCRADPASSNKRAFEGSRAASNQPRHHNQTYTPIWCFRDGPLFLANGSADPQNSCCFATNKASQMGRILPCKLIQPSRDNLRADILPRYLAAQSGDGSCVQRHLLLPYRPEAISLAPFVSARRRMAPNSKSERDTLTLESDTSFGDSIKGQWGNRIARGQHNIHLLTKPGTIGQPREGR
jgi:hypothetical protein